MNITEYIAQYYQVLCYSAQSNHRASAAFEFCHAFACLIFFPNNRCEHFSNSSSRMVVAEINTKQTDKNERPLEGKNLKHLSNISLLASPHAKKCWYILVFLSCIKFSSFLLYSYELCSLFHLQALKRAKQYKSLQYITLTAP